MTDSTNNGPPQEGLDPKLAILTDLSPATHPLQMEMGQERTIYTQHESTTATLMSWANEGPPQTGLDPKLLACVNDGESYHESYSAHQEHPPQICDIDHTDVVATNVINGAYAHATHPSYTNDMSGQNHRANVNSCDTEKNHAVLPFPAKAKATVQVNDVSNSENSNQKYSAHVIHVPSKSTKANNAQQANSNPNLTSSESLAEWNRIHSSNQGNCNYNFAEKSQRGNKRKAASLASTDGRKHGENQSVAASIAGAWTDASSGMKPLFTLHSEEGATAHTDIMAPVVHTTANNAPRCDSTLEEPPINSINTGAAALGYNAASPPAGTAANSNFWLQEEEERFLLGLRLYGWGQWKRIQTIVQTRTNKQIKSHAQKREKINPQIKIKYGKGKSRRGRISSKVLADDARAWAMAGGSMGKVEHAMLGNEETIPSLDQVWKDVYGTNNGDGPNSRHGRCRDRPQQGSQNQLALLDLGQQHAEKEPQTLQDSSSDPCYKKTVAETLHHYNPHMEASPSAAATSSADHLNSQTFRTYTKQSNQPPRQNTVPMSRYSSSAVLLPTLSPISAVVNHATAIRTSSSKQTSTAFDDSQLMPQKSHPNSHQKESLPQFLHIQYNNETENPTVPEKHDQSEQFYEEPIQPLPIDDMSRCLHPLDPGTPVYCKTNDMSGLEMHGRWLPGTIHSYRQVNHTGTNWLYSYHILFDNEEEEHEIPQQNVLGRTQYHKLKSKYQNNPHEEETSPIGDSFFPRETNNHFAEPNHCHGHLGLPGEHQHQQLGSSSHATNDAKGQAAGQLNLLFTASQMQTHGGASLE